MMKFSLAAVLTPHQLSAAAVPDITTERYYTVNTADVSPLMWSDVAKLHRVALREKVYFLLLNAPLPRLNTFKTGVFNLF